jgi:hypothetical protein
MKANKYIANLRAMLKSKEGYSIRSYDNYLYSLKNSSLSCNL